MTKRAPEQWHALFAAQQASGLNQAQFCKQQGLCPKHFSLRRRQLLEDNQEAPPTHQWITVQPMAEHSPEAQISMNYQGAELHFSSADAVFIAHVIKQLA